MTQAMQMGDFFAMEAGEYLERLDGLVSRAESPDAEELHKLTRALRGSALMAGQQQVARVAGGLEALARGVKTATIGWDEAIRQLAIRAVDDLKVLVRAVNNWGTSEDARVHGIATELEKITGSTPVAGSKEPLQLDPGTRAFIAREGAAVGSALDLAAKALARNPAAVDTLESVRRALQPLRGIASLSDLPPLPDLLDGIERAVQELTGRTEPHSNPGDVFDAAAKAVSLASQEITAKGQANPDSPEASEFARQIGLLMEMGPDIVPVESLYHADAGPHIVTQGTPPQAEAATQLEVVSLAERLNQAADDLGSAQSNTQRQLRAHALAPTLRALKAAGPHAAQMANAVRDAISRGVATSDTNGLAQQLRSAGSILSSWGQGQDETEAQNLAAVAAQLGVLGTAAAPATAVPAAAVPAAAVPAAPTPAPATLPTTLPVAMPAAPAPMAAAVPAVAGAEQTGLAASMDTYHRLREAAGSAQAPLEEFLAGPPTLSATTAPVASSEALAPITEYCYSGQAALKRAMELRKQLSSGSANDLVEEILDLVQLGLQTPA